MNIYPLAKLIEQATRVVVIVQGDVPPMADAKSQSRFFLEVRASRELGPPRRLKKFNTATQLFDYTMVSENLATLQLKLEVYVGSDLYAFEKLSQFRNGLFSPQFLDAAREIGFAISKSSGITRVPSPTADIAVMEFDVIWAEVQPDKYDESWIEKVQVTANTTH